jgi:hypothetical protein
MTCRHHFRSLKSNLSLGNSCVVVSRLVFYTMQCSGVLGIMRKNSQVCEYLMTMYSYVMWHLLQGRWGVLT